MASICGVCLAQPSKYRCPSCELRYCSIACFKSHKEIHADDRKQHEQPPPSTATQSVTPLPQTQPEPPPPPPPSRPASKKLNFSAFEHDPDLIRLMARYPHLRIQLQSVYGLTLEPPPQEQRPFNTRGRGAWRGGRGRGGRGGYGHHQQQQQQRPSQWTQAKGDKEAADAFRKMRDSEGETEGMAEFVQLLKIKFHPASHDDAPVHSAT